MQQWLVGAQMVGCAQRLDGVWTCQLNRAAKKNWIVWNPQYNLKFDVPRDWKVADVVPLLQEGQPLKASTVDIGPIPVLLEGLS
jgi:hypothetical protein